MKGGKGGYISVERRALEEGEVGRTGGRAGKGGPEVRNNRGAA